MTHAKSDAVLDAIERHWEAPVGKPLAGALLREVQSPDSLRRADALFVPISTAARGTLIGYEVKVSRSDLMSEIRDGTKADGWYPYCSRWWLVVSAPKIVEGLMSQIPDTWGIATPPTDARRRRLTVLREAPALRPIQSTKALGTVLAKILYGGDSAEQRMRRAQQATAAAVQQHAQIAEEVKVLRAELGTATSARLSVAKIIAAIEEQGGYSPPKEGKPFASEIWNVRPEHIATAALLLASSEDADAEIARMARLSRDRAQSFADRLGLLMDGYHMPRKEPKR